MSASLQDTLALLRGAKNKFARGGGKTVKLKEGRTKVRILQGADPKFWRELGVHWIKDSADKVVAAVGSYDYTYDKPCPLATAIAKAARTATSDEELKLYKDWARVKKTILVNALILDGPDASPEPQILELNASTFDSFRAIMEEYAEEVGNVLDADNGIDFIFERRGKGMDTEYSVMPAPKSKAIDKAVLKRLQDLDAFIEREYFSSSKENKAIAFIGEMSGLKLSAPVRSGLLSGPSASVAEEVDAPFEGGRTSRATPPTIEVEVVKETPTETVARVEAAKASKAAPKAVETSGDDLAGAELDDVLAELDGI